MLWCQSENGRKDEKLAGNVFLHCNGYRSSQMSSECFRPLQKNHLSGLRHTFLKVSFNTVQELMSVKSELLPIVERNQAKLEASQAYDSLFEAMR
jgi:hypothetical protein